MTGERWKIVTGTTDRGGAGTASGPLDACIFDMDGVVTDTATVHARCWAQVFDALLTRRSGVTGVPFEAFGHSDYLRFVDGKPRYDGAAGFLASRGITLPTGRPDDPAGYGSVCSVANMKEGAFRREIEDRGVRVFASTVDFVRALRERGVRTGLMTSSRHGRSILEEAELTGLFDVIVDGADADGTDLAGKPDPSVTLWVARRLEAPPDRTGVVDDSLAGVEAGRRGGFSPVIGVDRGAGRAELLAHGADLVVADLAEVHLAEFGGAAAVGA